MSDLISLDEARRKARPEYLNHARILDLCAALEAEVGDITRGSVNSHGAIDPIAYEINTHVIAIRRAIDADDNAVGGE